MGRAGRAWLLPAPRLGVNSLPLLRRACPNPDEYSSRHPSPRLRSPLLVLTLRRRGSVLGRSSRPDHGAGLLPSLGGDTGIPAGGGLVRLVWRRRSGIAGDPAH